MTAAIRIRLRPPTNSTYPTDAPAEIDNSVTVSVLGQAEPPVVESVLAALDADLGNGLVVEGQEVIVEGLDEGYSAAQRSAAVQAARDQYAADNQGA